MKNLDSNRPQEIVIYTNEKISPDFYQPFQDGLFYLSSFTIKTLEQIPSQTENKIHIVILGAHNEMNNLQLSYNKIHFIVPSHSNNKLEKNLNTLIFEHDHSMTPQQALENLYHNFIKFYFSTKYYLDPQDFFNSYMNGYRYIKMHSVLQNDIDYEKQLKTYLQMIPDTETVCFNFSISYDYPSESDYLPLLQNTITHLKYVEDREAFFGIVLSKHSISDNKVSILHLSQEPKML
ncbi:hypothetical protein [Acinetobacter sp. ANC 4639]